MNSEITIAPFGQSMKVGSAKSYHTVLAKFFFTNPKHIPQGIFEKSRADDEVLDENHARTAEILGRADLGAVGRVREGRVDTGVNFIHNLQNVHAGCLVRGLANAGYGVNQCHWFFKKGNETSSDKYVVVVSQTLYIDTSKIPATAVAQRRILANTCWKYCHGWANPDGVVTLNFGGRLPDGKHQHSVIVRDSMLTAARITELVTEENE